MECPGVSKSCPEVSSTHNVCSWERHREAEESLVSGATQAGANLVRMRETGKMAPLKRVKHSERKLNIVKHS